MTWEAEDIVDWRELLRNETVKWDGYTLTLGQFMTSAYRQIYSIYELMEENTRIGATLWIVAKLFETIAVHKINSYKEFVKNKIICTICEQADKLFYNPNEIQSKSENKFKSSFMIELNMRLQEILFTMTKDQVHEVMRHYMNEKGWLIGGGLELLARLIEVYGRKPLQTATIPYTFDWSANKINVCWHHYKIKLQEDNFFITHPSLTSTAIAYAKKGFEQHDIGPRLLDYIRTELGDGHDFTWDEFCDKVERFLGDPYRRAFTNATLFNQICNEMFEYKSLKEHDSENVCQIKNYKDPPDKYPNLEFDKAMNKYLG